MDKRDRALVHNYNLEMGRDLADREEPIVCPAGEFFQGASPEDSGCHCRIDGSLLKVKTEPTTLRSYCTQTFTHCPTWRAAKNREKTSERRSLTQDPEEIAKLAQQ